MLLWMFCYFVLSVRLALRLFRAKAHFQQKKEKEKVSPNYS